MLKSAEDEKWNRKEKYYVFSDIMLYILISVHTEKHEQIAEYAEYEKAGKAVVKTRGGKSGGCLGDGHAGEVCERGDKPCSREIAAPCYEQNNKIRWRVFEDVAVFSRKKKKAAGDHHEECKGKKNGAEIFVADAAVHKSRDADADSGENGFNKCR